jgi:hypothetical protein
VVAVLVRVLVDLLRVDRFGSEFVLGTETHLSTQAVGLDGIVHLLGVVAAVMHLLGLVHLLGSFAAGHLGSLVAVLSDAEVEAGLLLGILVDILEVTDLDVAEAGNHYGLDDVAPLLANGQPGLDHYQSVSAQID